MCWEKTQSAAEANPKESLWDGMRKGLEWKQMLFFTRLEVGAEFAFLLEVAASKYLDKELHEGKVQIVSVLENKAGGKRQLESCWVTGALEEGAHRASRRRLPMRLSFHLMIGRQMAKEAALEGQLRC